MLLILLTFINNNFIKKIHIIQSSWSRITERISLTRF